MSALAGQLKPGGVDWPTVRRALADEVASVTAMLRRVTQPDAPALGTWTLTDVAVHLSQAFLAIPDLARGDLSRFYEGVPGSERSQHGGSLIGDIQELSTFTTTAVSASAERDLSRLADLISERSAAYLVESGSRSAHERHPWMVEGTIAAQPTFACHLLGEVAVHGYDMALADGRPWKLDRAHAALVVDGFMMPVLQVVGRSLLQPEAAGLRVTYEIALRGGGKWYLRFAGGDLEIHSRPAGRVDCHLSVDPAAFLLVAWGRIGQWPAIGKGQMIAWGLRPWMGPRLRSLLRNP